MRLAAKCKLSVVLVEDDETDRLQFMRFAKRNNVDHLVTCFDGAESALEFLRKQEKFSNTSRFVVLTDINMPEMNGHEFIEEIRRDNSIENSVIFVISSSDFEMDRARAYRNKIAGYIVKDVAGAAFDRTTRMLRSYCESVII